MFLHLSMQELSSLLDVIQEDIRLPTQAPTESDKLFIKRWWSRSNRCEMTVAMELPQGHFAHTKANRRVGKGPSFSVLEDRLNFISDVQEVKCRMAPSGSRWPK